MPSAMHWQGCHAGLAKNTFWSIDLLFKPVLAFGKLYIKYYCLATRKAQTHKNILQYCDQSTWLVSSLSIGYVLRHLHYYSVINTFSQGNSAIQLQL
jgi:hypothetical protein